MLSFPQFFFFQILFDFLTSHLQAHGFLFCSMESTAKKRKKKEKHGTNDQPLRKQPAHSKAIVNLWAVLVTPTLACLVIKVKQLAKTFNCMSPQSMAAAVIVLGLGALLLLFVLLFSQRVSSYSCKAQFIASLHMACYVSNGYLVCLPRRQYQYS